MQSQPLTNQHTNGFAVFTASSVARTVDEARERFNGTAIAGSLQVEAVNMQVEHSGVFQMALRTSIVFLALSVLPADAQEQPRRDERRAEMMKQLELTKPGDEHVELKKLAGSWDVSMSMGNKDLGFDGKATATMILGDRFLVIDGTGKPQGRDTAFRYTIGFDRRHNEYVITLRDTAGTYPVHARGKRTENGVRMSGTDNDPRMTAMGLKKKFAFRFDIKNESEFTIETIYIDTRTSTEKDRPAFRYVFTRNS